MSTSAEDRITRTPGICGGKACIAGRVRVLDIVVWHEHQGLTPDEIVSHIPTISLGDVHAAFAYYFDHIEEIQQEMRAERALADEFGRSHPSLVEAKLRPERVEEASLPVPIRFHLDENISTRIAFGLRRRNIDVTATADAGLVGALDGAQLEFAASVGARKRGGGTSATWLTTPDS